MPETPALDVRGLTVRYGDVTAVHDLTLAVPRGETVALLGANGAGKSSVVNAALGLFRPAAGTVRLLGREPTAALQAGGVGAMLQHGGLPSEARVGEVLALVRRRYQDPWPLADLAATAGIGGVLDRSVDALSGGQRQRVLLALALAGAPPLLLLDEPTSAMDVEGRQAFWATMRDLAGRGHTVVFATHHLDEADAVADRVVVVAGGRVVADGSAAAIKSRIAGRTVRFRCPGPRDGLSGLPGVTSTGGEGDWVELATSDAEATLRALLAGHDALPDLEVRGASLEQAFLHLTSTADGALR
ncbi:MULTISPECIES: ATP-binding cassette domain-containing protein [unclassified Modestobacter]|uniref:ATP-binding cassette domain-containing protein n=1 Tax=unclassified Modestobacter TaxID=2643866 RepID=UPI0022AA5C52|nr:MULTISPECIES: ATP-binding cassette domain-containing protein [unclassified Modestobacter]MCZ2824563.1 ATP-binding cassette domain-containing protein [Modestobacter sp. VKM Ac-2981]MCZ2853909.1 ATP-binding cassette domain-containing protein [Modestobacter sp. VKM Ac-2982]